MTEDTIKTSTYTIYPDGKFQNISIEIGGSSKEDLVAAISEKNMLISKYAEKLLQTGDFYIASNKETVNLISLAVGNLGFSQGATTGDIYQRAQELGLELCPPEVGPLLRLAYTGNDWMYIGMNPISSSETEKEVFCLVVNEIEDRLELGAVDGNPERLWPSDYHMVFRLK